MDQTNEDRRAYLMHKPINVVCSTVDSALTDIVRDEGSKKFGGHRGGVSRMTIYDAAKSAGFPTNYGNIGRLDAETSGILLFTTHNDFFTKVRDPAISKEEYEADRSDGVQSSTAPSSSNHTSYEQYLQTKSKQYELVVLSGRNVTKQLVANDMQFNPEIFESQMGEPFTFQRNNIQFQTTKAEVKVLERYQSEQHSHGRPELGWCIRCLITLREGLLSNFCQISSFLP